MVIIEDKNRIINDIQQFKGLMPFITTNCRNIGIPVGIFINHINKSEKGIFIRYMNNDKRLTNVTELKPEDVYFIIKKEEVDLFPKVERIKFYQDDKILSISNNTFYFSIATFNLELTSQQYEHIITFNL